MSSSSANVHVLVDFDGTIVPDDVTDHILLSFADPSWLDLEAEWKAGRIGSRQCLGAQVDLIRAKPEDIARAVSERAIDPAFPAFVNECKRRGIGVTVVSDGFDLAIETMLKRHNLDLPYYANHLEWLGGDRWRLGFPHRNDSCKTEAGNCKCRRVAAGPMYTVVIGDGRSDFCAASNADFVLSKSALTDHCQETNLRHWPIQGFAEVVERFDGWLAEARKLAPRAVPAQAPARIPVSAKVRPAPVAPKPIPQTVLETNLAPQLSTLGAMPSKSKATGVTTSIRDRSYFQAGSKTGFLLIHGLTGTPIELRYIANGLARAGFTVSVPQLAGHCGTIEDLKATRWQDWYQSAEDALLELRKTCDLVLVGGLSMGAVIALKLAANHPETVDGTTLFAPTFRFDGWSMPWYGRLFDLVNDTWTADRFLFTEREPYGIKNIRFREFVMNAVSGDDSSEAGLPGTPGRSLMQFRYLTKIVDRELGLIRQPALVLHPREDDKASLSNVEYLQRRLGGRVTTVVLEDCYHLITLDQQRDVVLEETRDFGFKLEQAAMAAKKIEPRTKPARIGAGLTMNAISPR